MVMDWDIDPGVECKRGIFCVLYNPQSRVSPVWGLDQLVQSVCPHCCKLGWGPLNEEEKLRQDIFIAEKDLERAIGSVRWHEDRLQQLQEQLHGRIAF